MGIQCAQEAHDNRNVSNVKIQQTKKKFQRKKKFSIGCLLLSPLKNIEETAERLLLIAHMYLLAFEKPHTQYSRKNVFVGTDSTSVTQKINS